MTLVPLVACCVLEMPHVFTCYTDLAENPSGCARCEPFQKTSIQKRITSRAPRVTDADDTRYQSPVVESGIKNRDLLTASFGSSRAEV